MVSGTRALLKYVMIVVEGWSRAAAPKGSMTYAFTHMGDFLLLLLLLLLLLFFLGSGPKGPMSCRTQG